MWHPQNIKIVGFNYKFGGKIMINNKYAYKYETPYKGSFEITQCFTNDVVVF